MSPYDEGFDAGFRGMPVDCPYEPGSFAYNDWLNGYDAGVEAWEQEEEDRDGQDN